VRRFFAFIFLLLVIAAAVMAYTLLLPVRFSQSKTVLLRPGWGARRIAFELKGAGVIRSAHAFLLLHALKVKPLRAGEYRFDHPQNALQVYDRLARGDIVIHTVVVPEGFTMFDIAAAVEAAGLGRQEEFLKVAQTDTLLIKDIDPQAQSLEGYLFPDTYNFTRTQSMQDIAAAMVRRFRQEANATGLVQVVQPANEGDRRDPLYVHRVVTMASIVEKETAAPEERPTVASVYYNRLQRNMPLQADPSVIYAALLEGQYKGTIYQSDLNRDSPYNTYRVAGLPPGPIANPGHASLVAAMHPADSSYLFFVSDGQGHHRFSTNIAEHNRNVEAYRHNGH
jgi:UPF0755 protein